MFLVQTALWKFLLLVWMETPKIGLLEGLVMIIESIGSGTFGLKTPFLYTLIGFLALLLGGFIFGWDFTGGFQLEESS